MKKISTILVVALMISLLSIPFNVSAIEPTYVFDAPKLVIPVELGQVNPVESWEDANVLVLDINNAILNEFGRWQGDEANDKPGADKLSVTYRIKWDETYLYIREERFDTSYHFTYDHAREPWIGDGTLFAFAYDNGDPKWEHSYQPFWANKCSDGLTHIAVRCWKDGTYGMFDEAEDIGNWKYAGTQSGDVYTTELAVPWSDLQAYTSGMPAAAEGLKFRFAPIVPNVSTDDAFGSDWNQMNFHDRFGRDDADTEEADNPGELPANWAGFVLGAATYTPPAPDPEPAVDETAMGGGDENVHIEPAAVPAPVAVPQTGDVNIISILMVMALVTIIFTATRRRFVKN